jgi:hypothetical protein
MLVFDMDVCFLCSLLPRACLQWQAATHVETPTSPPASPKRDPPTSGGGGGGGSGGAGLLSKLQSPSSSGLLSWLGTPKTEVVEVKPRTPSASPGTLSQIAATVDGVACARVLDRLCEHACLLVLLLLLQWFVLFPCRK